MSFSLAAFGLSVIGFLWPQGSGGFGGKITVGKLTDIDANDRRRARASATTPRPACGSRTTRRPRSRRPRRCGVHAADARRHGGGRRRAVPEVRAPRLPRAGCLDVAVVRVPVPRLAVQPGRREEGRPRAAWPRPLHADVHAAASSPWTPARSSSSARRSAPTPPARRPKARTASAVASTRTDDLRRTLTNETIGWAIFIVIARRRRRLSPSINVLRSGKPEVGSEIELAPNRKPYLPDEELEGPKLDRALTSGLLTLFIIAIGLPLYWIIEPGRQANAATDFNAEFVDAGRGDVRADRHEPRRAQLRRLPRRRRARRGRRYTLHEPDGTVDRSSSGRRRRSTPCCCATAAKRSRTSSRTAGRSRRCRRGASPAAARSTTSRSRTSSTTSSRSRSRPSRRRNRPRTSSPR